MSQKECHHNYVYIYNCLKLSQMIEYILTLSNMPSELLKPPVHKIKINIVFSILRVTQINYFNEFCLTLERILSELPKDLFIVADSKLYS